MEKTLILQRGLEEQMIDYYGGLYDIKAKRTKFKSIYVNDIEIDCNERIITKEGIATLIEYFKIPSNDSLIDYSYMFKDIKFVVNRYANRLFFFDSLDALVSTASSLEGISKNKINETKTKGKVVTVKGLDYFYYLGDTADYFSLLVGVLNKYGSETDKIKIEYNYITKDDLMNKNKSHDFFQWFDTNKDEQLQVAKEWNENNKRLKTEFLNEWPLDRLRNMELDEYVVGKGADARSFCYDLELGKYSSLYLSIKGGSAGKFGIYWSATKQSYCDQANKTIDEDEVENTFENVKEDLVNIIEQGILFNFDEPLFNRKSTENSFFNRTAMVTKLLCIYSENKDYFGANIKYDQEDVWLNLAEYPEQGSYYKQNFEIMNVLKNKYPEIDADLFCIILWNYRNHIIEKLKDWEVDFNEAKSGYQSSYSEQVITSKNVIFRGSPGTGKSYLAKEIASDIVSEGETKDFLSLDAEQASRIEFVQFHPSYDYTDFVEGLRPRLADDGSMKFVLENGIFKSFSEKAINDSSNNYVFIIDEINRGEISKIFGELFYSIDPGYRGKSGAISTQYSNLLDEVEEKFYVPNNLYIIGTMNDIDRSVDSFDFAMRRRFRFIEIKAKDNVQMLDLIGNKKTESIERMNNLNDAISNVEGLNDNYHVGPSYFLNLKNDLNYDELWDDFLEPLVHDYVRGLYDEKGILENLKQAYNNHAVREE